MRMHILILTGVQNGWISRWKNTQVLLKTVQFEAYFLRWRLFVWPLLVLYSDFLKMLSFSILILWHRYAHSHANSGSKGRITSCKKVLFCKKAHFWSLICNIKITCMPTVWFTFLLFTTNDFFFSSWVVAYAWRFPS